MFENFLDHCRAEWKPSPARAVAGESSAYPIVYRYFEQFQVTDVLRLGKIPELERERRVKMRTREQVRNLLVRLVETG